MSEITIEKIKEAMLMLAQQENKFQLRDYAETLYEIKTPDIYAIVSKESFHKALMENTKP